MYLIEGFEALGTVWYIEIFEPIKEDVFISAKTSLRTKIYHFENTYSRFRQDSLLSTLNQTRKVSYDHDMACMLGLGTDMMNATGGVFNLFIADALVDKGYGESVEKIKKSDSDKPAYSITEDTISLHGPLSVDLGGIGKGYLIDLLAKMLVDEFSITQFLINGGGDMYATSIQGEPVQVFLQHPKKRNEVFGCIYLKNQALCASSSYVRSWTKDGVIKNHFVTPKGEEVWSGSFTVASSAVLADMLATVLCITSHDTEFCERISKRYNSTYLVYKDNEEYFGDLMVSHYD